MMARVTLLLAVLSLSLSSSCARQETTVTPHPITEAYRLLDLGETARAIALLERLVGQNPDNAEARLLLASAYMGSAGVDIYRLHTTFQDVLFNESLKDRLLSASPAAPTAAKSDPAERPPISELSERIDDELSRLKQVVTFLNRFPDVPEREWPMLDQALSLLSLEMGKDVILYRVFIRIVYAKSFLTERVLGDRKFGTKAWLCSFKTSVLREQIHWLNQITNEALIDFERHSPRDSENLAQISGILRSLDYLLDAWNGSVPTLRELRMVLNCKEGTQ